MKGQHDTTIGTVVGTDTVRSLVQYPGSGFHVIVVTDDDIENLRRNLECQQQHPILATAIRKEQQCATS